MGVINEIKDTTRKATNTVIDTTQEALDIPKSPKELAKRLIEHLTHKEYFQIAKILIEEAKKYINKLGLDDIELVNNKLEDFENMANELASNLDNEDYQQVLATFKEVEALVPTLLGESSEISKTIKGFFTNTRKTLEEYINSAEKGGTNNSPDFSKLESKFEESFQKFIGK